MNLFQVIWVEPFQTYGYRIGRVQVRRDPPTGEPITQLLEDIDREEGGDSGTALDDSDSSSSAEGNESGDSGDFLLNEQRRVVEEQPDNVENDEDDRAEEETPRPGQRRSFGDTRPTGTYRQKRRGPGQYISRAKYYRYHAQRRDPTGQKRLHRFHRLYHMGTLSQKYLCSVAWDIEANNEEHEKRAQTEKQLRRATRAEFKKHLEERAKRRTAEGVPFRKLGRVFMRPENEPGSSRYMSINCMKAGAILRKMKPDCGFFITVTSNCKCDAAKRMLDSRNPPDHSDICLRVARQTFRQIMFDLKGPNGLFGNCIGWVWSKEFQKRGLPHWHVVILLRAPEGVNPATAEFIDQYITAEIPDEPDVNDHSPAGVRARKYFETVGKQYIHTCTDACKTKKKKCRFSFPFGYQNETKVTV
jgi:hypothetical protein